MVYAVSMQKQTSAVPHRELVKMIVMFPLLIVRSVLIIVALLMLAIMSFIAGLGWCVLPYAIPFAFPYIPLVIVCFRNSLTLGSPTSRPSNG